MRRCDNAMHVAMRRRRPYSFSITERRKAGETEGGASCREKTTYERKPLGFSVLLAIEKGAMKCPQPIENIGCGGGFEPSTFGL
jgi:hypothetical protein